MGRGVIVPGDPGAYKRRKTEESDPAPQRAHFPACKCFWEGEGVGLLEERVGMHPA